MKGKIYVQNLSEVYYKLKEAYGKQMDVFMSKQEEELSSRVGILQTSFAQQYEISERVRDVLSYFGKAKNALISEYNNRHAHLESTLRIISSLLEIHEIIYSENHNNFPKAFQQLKTNVSDFPLLAVVIGKVPENVAKNGVETKKELKNQFKELHRVEVPVGEGDQNIFLSVASHLQHYNNTPPEGLIEGSDTESIVARACYQMSRGTLQGTLSELNKLEGPAAQIFQNWMVKAKDRLNLEQALSILSIYVHNSINEEKCIIY